MDNLKIAKSHNPILSESLKGLIALCKQNPAESKDFITQAKEIICSKEKLELSCLDEKDILVRLFMAIEFWESPLSRHYFEKYELKKFSGVPAKIAKAVNYIAKANIGVD